MLARPIWHRMIFLTVIGLGALGFGGCGSLMHPKADAFLEQAKGTSPVETGLTLIGMMQKQIAKEETQRGDKEALDDLHNQFHALQHVFCLMTESQRASKAYIHSVTLKKELKTVFHRLWEYKDDPVQRPLHLGLMAARLEEFRLAFEAIGQS